MGLGVPPDLISQVRELRHREEEEFVHSAWLVGDEAEPGGGGSAGLPS